MDLVRLKNGVEFDRLPLGPFYDVSDAGKAVVQRWPVQNNDNKNALAHIADEAWQNSEAIRIQKRPVVQIMKLGDYNHDDNATEFYLPTMSLPCGKNTGVVIGITLENSRLHALGSELNSTKPLVLKKWQWDALLKSAGPQTVPDWKCGDHGTTEETDLELEAKKRGISVTENHYRCPRIGKGTLIRSESY